MLLQTNFIDKPPPEVNMKQSKPLLLLQCLMQAIIHLFFQSFEFRSTLQNQVARTKRLRLMVREDGIILGAAADNAWALDALGVDPTKIIHQPLAQYIDVFADASRSLPSGRLTPTLVTSQPYNCSFSVCPSSPYCTACDIMCTKHALLLTLLSSLKLLTA